METMQLLCHVTSTPLNPAFTAPQVASALAHLTVSHLIISAETNLPRKPPSPNLSTIQHLVADLDSSQISSELVPSLQSIIFVDNTTPNSPNPAPSHRALTPYAHLIAPSLSSATFSPRSLDKNETVNIQFTSGTTSAPKAACLSHRSILNNGYHIGSRLGLTSQDVVCCPPPLFHCFGSILGYMATATHGSCIVFPSESFNALESLTAVREEQCTALYGVPTMFLSALEILSSRKEEFPKAAFDRSRTGIAAGTQVPATLMRRLQRELGLQDLCICYGMTETSPVSVMTSPEDSMKARTETVGKTMPHITAKVVASCTDSAGQPSERIANIHEKGELLVSGYSVMSGYWADPSKTAEVLVQEAHSDGRSNDVSPAEQKTWMRTGDEAAMDEHGYVRITGRLKDLIIRGGENVRPGEVEDILLGCEGVGEVSCFALPDEKYGEAVATAIIRRREAGQQEQDQLDEVKVRDFVRDRLANHCIPKHVFFVETLPKTPSGKIQRFKLRDEFEKRSRLSR
ncbi:MAG: hypothetical protein Q9159_004782 [Coniocarpon cinnabarinum]